MEVRFAGLADAANVSREGKLNITGIFNIIWAGNPDQPILWPSMDLVLLVEAHASEVGNHSLRINVVDAEGTLVIEQNGEFPIPPPEDPGYPIRTQFVLKYQNVSFPKIGDYSFDIFIDGRYQDSAILHIRPVAGGQAPT